MRLDQLPALFAATEAAGRVRRDVATDLGLPAGIPVLAGPMDSVAAAFGSGAIQPRRGLAVLGTIARAALVDDVVTVMWGEFGRTPKINMSDAGRDHWSPAMSALVAGGGLKMAQAIGSTSARGEHPKDRPYKVPQLLATLYQAIGIDPAMTFPNGTGRPMYILDDRKPVSELL